VADPLEGKLPLTIGLMANSILRSMAYITLGEWPISGTISLSIECPGESELGHARGGRCRSSVDFRSPAKAGASSRMEPESRIRWDRITFAHFSVSRACKFLFVSDKAYMNATPMRCTERHTRLH